MRDTSCWTASIHMSTFRSPIMVPGVGRSRIPSLKKSSGTFYWQDLRMDDQSNSDCTYPNEMSGRTAVASQRNAQNKVPREMRFDFKNRPQSINGYSDQPFNFLDSEAHKFAAHIVSIDLIENGDRLA